MATTSTAGPTSTLKYDPAGNRTEYVVTTGNGAAGGGSGAGSFAIVADGSFEYPPQPAGGHQYNPPVTSASFAYNSGVAANGSAWGFTAPSGSQVAFLQSGPHAAEISLTVSGLAVGASYFVSFRIARRTGYDPVPVTVTFDGAPLGVFTPASTAFSGVKTVAFVPTSPAGTLRFTGIASGSDLSTGLDAVTVQALPPTLADASFEDPTVATYQYGPAPTGTTFTSAAGVSRNGSVWNFAAAPDGSQVAFLQGSTAAITLTASGLTPGARYRIRFHLAARTGQAGVPLAVSFTDANNQTFALGTLSPASSAFAQLTTPSAFTATGTTGTVKFAAQSVAGDQTSAIDGISLEPAP